jgi:HAD superfamily phosphoserine phosphatase-like hydrolase
MKEKNKIICFDANGTIVDEDTWAMFGENKQEIDEALADYGDKKISIVELWDRMARIFRSTGMATKDFIYEYWRNNCNLRNGAEDLINYLKKKGYKIYLISCSIEPCLESITKTLSLDGFFAGSHLVFDAKGELEKIESECSDKLFKEKKIRGLAEAEKVDVRDIVFVGDGYNDIGAFEATGKGIAINSDIPDLLAVSWKRVRELSEIKDIL